MCRFREHLFERTLNSLLLSAVFSVLADAGALFFRHPLPVPAFLAVFALLLLLLWVLPLPVRLRRGLLAGLLALCLAGGLGAVWLWRRFTAGAVYREADSGKEALYGGRKVLVVLPHEDDDLNLLYGVTEQYLKYGSQLYFAYLTNGDCGFSAQERLSEALAMADYYGVGEDHVFFLGYGNNWDSDVHLYNSEPDQIRTSYAGFTETYGIEGHPAYREGNPYTRRHLLEDLESLILELRPDLLISCDYDGHQDHRVCSLFFEEAVGQVLARTPGYRPLVLKGFAYSLGYYGLEDFYSLNIAPSHKLGDGPAMDENGIYRWDSRLRLPVAAEALSRSQYSSAPFGVFACYASQNMIAMVPRVVNGDKVFWPRVTSSLSYAAQVSASSGQAARLNNFKLADAEDVVHDDVPLDGVWTPEEGDAEPWAEMTLARPAELVCLRLYDAPSPEDNVLDALISFDDGTQLHTGPLDPLGAPTEIPLENVHSACVRVTLLETEGEGAGLTELEVYDRAPDPGLRFIKLQDTEGSFAYDYCIPRGGTAAFTLYAVGCPAELTEENYRVSIQGKGCTARIEGGELLVHCSLGRSCQVTVTGEEGVSDSVFVSRAGLVRPVGQRLEDLRFYLRLNLQYLASFRCLTWILK